MNLEINLLGKKLEINSVKKAGFFKGVIGLMFSRRERASALLFNHRGAIHSFFVFFSFLCFWLDNKNNVIEIKIIRPFTFHATSKKPFFKILEIPLSRRYHSIVKLLVGERFKNKKLLG